MIDIGSRQSFTLRASIDRLKLIVARVRRIHPVRDRAHPRIDLNTKANAVAVSGHERPFGLPQQKVGLDDLKSKRHAATTELRLNLSDQHLAILKHGAHRQPQDRIHRELSGSVATIAFRPLQPCLFDAVIEFVIRRPVRLHDLSLNADAGADNVVLDNALQV